MSDPKNVIETAHGSARPDEYLLQLFVTGATPNSLRAIANMNSLCEQYLKDRYRLEIIDVYQEKDQAREQQIVALPMLIKRWPLPERKLVGDMSKTEKVLEALGL